MTTFAEYPVADTAGGALARAYLAGDREAFATLFRRYYPDLLWFLSGRLRDHALAEDLAQETLLRALRSMPTYDPTREIWPWLRTIASRLASAESTRRGTELPVEEVDRGESHDDGTDAVISRDAVLQALSTIPERQSRALVMRYVEDRDPGDIATLFGLSRSALEQLLWRARRSFEKEYRRRNGALVPGFAALTARLRRFLHGFETKLHVASGATMSLAGDFALGAAITVGGIGLVAAAQPPVAAPRTSFATVRTVASTTSPLRHAGDARDVASHLSGTASRARSAATAAASSVPVATTPGDAPGSRPEAPLTPTAPDAPGRPRVGGTGHVDGIADEPATESGMKTTRTHDVPAEAPAGPDKVGDVVAFADGNVAVDVVDDDDPDAEVSRDDGATVACVVGTCVKP